MKILMVIPARSGSRRLPHKNVKLLGDIPLICWSLKAAEQARIKLKGHECRVTVSTDSDEYVRAIMDYYIGQGMDKKDVVSWMWSEIAPFTRPKDISEDVDTGLVLKHAYEWWRDNRNFDAELVVLLQPTSPFRTYEDIVECVDSMSGITYGRLGSVNTEIIHDTVFTVKNVSEFPQWMFYHDEGTGRARSWLGFPTRFLSGLIAQDIQELYIPNGAVYVTKRSFIEQGRIYGDKCYFVDMPLIRSVDIETAEDFALAEWLLETGRIK